MGIVASHSTEGRRQVEQIRLDGLKTAAERNKWGQFATPPELALNLARYARNLAGESAIRFLDPKPRKASGVAPTSIWCAGISPGSGHRSGFSISCLPIHLMSGIIIYPARTKPA